MGSETNCARSYNFGTARHWSEWELQGDACMHGEAWCPQMDIRVKEELGMMLSMCWCCGGDMPCPMVAQRALAPSIGDAKLLARADRI